MRAEITLVVGLDNRLEEWHKRHSRYSPGLWALSRFLYRAKGLGPEGIEGPAVVVFDSHKFSTDAIMPSYLKMYLAMVARSDRTLLSFLARYGGGPTFDEKKSVHTYLFRQLLLLLREKQAVGMFPFSDVHNGKPQHKVLEAVLKWEMEEKVPQVGYYAAAIVYSSLVSFADRPLRMWPSYWPIPFLTSSTILISGSPVFARQLKSEGRNVEDLVSALAAESSALRQRYLGR